MSAINHGTIHICVDIRGVLQWPAHRLVALFSRRGEKKPSVHEVREYLYDEIAKGHKVLPFGKPCDGFSYVDGCPGHPLLEGTTDA